ncbi:hypothetical protein ACFQFC_22475 [Amorphoplanes digitatis]|uniref:Uncharacterized protein n=1 Tax=Actinoplanes digitatis TaxID=1868 RepID=A0A7W7MUP8_9ACTN|nr:hypothetical protein [Actinoplanes digitatis]MBB4766987.1 hypothetical protein [Actinoplanes digitatis]BFE77235.1 hypothetical protein GCM10020092_105360 [Actinoplanes digitatis]GID95523.1 hypothetical protein Adi01nite_49350 [Actinoplanes digitatis]
MTTIDCLVDDSDIDDSDIDVPIDDRDQGERRAQELAHRIRTVAFVDPEQAQRLVDELIVRLDVALGGTFSEHLDGAAREAAERVIRKSRNGHGAGVSPPGNS